MKRFAIAIGICLLLLVRAQADGLKVSSTAPDFTARANDGSHVHLYAILDHAPIILYFYPKDDSPEGVKEACAWRDSFSAFHDLKTTILGVSYDSVLSHQKFIQANHLPFLLISDPGHDVARAYGANGLFAAKLQTFIIDKTGTIVYVNRFVDLSTQSLELQNILAQL